MMIHAYINWTLSPEIFKLGPFSIRWYGLLWAVSFVLGYMILSWIYQQEKKSQKDLDSLTIMMIIGTVLGARLGHCLFYSPEYYLANPLEILKVWEGGLASHGAAVGILIALWLYKRRRKNISLMWIFDRIVIVIALAAFFIRVGNFFNHEILGKPADVPWAVVFNVYGAGLAVIGTTEPLHPVQLYEAFSYLLIFLFLLFFYKRTKSRFLKGNFGEGFTTGLFLILLFGARFFIEFYKQVQVDFEKGMSLDMGQMLSIPFFLLGAAFLIRSFFKK